MPDVAPRLPERLRAAARSRALAWAALLAALAYTVATNYLITKVELPHLLSGEEYAYGLDLDAEVDEQGRVVLRPIPGGEAAHAGVRPGDVFLSMELGPGEVAFSMEETNPSAPKDSVARSAAEMLSQQSGSSRQPFGLIVQRADGARRGSYMKATGT